MALILLGAVIIFLLLSHRQGLEVDTSVDEISLVRSDSEEVQETQDDSVEQTTDTNEESERNRLLDLRQQYSEFDKVEIESLNLKLKTLAKYSISGGGGIETLVSELREGGLTPQLRIDENPYTGKMSVVRTTNTIPGTRYFHAQFFENENGDDFLQHMSFEFRPGDNSLAIVREMIPEIFGVDEVVHQTEKFISWRHDDYVVWVKKMELSDLQNDPFNAYTEADVGVVRVAVELEIHDHAPAFHMQMGD